MGLRLSPPCAAWGIEAGGDECAKELGGKLGAGLVHLNFQDK